jgi:hypothetical protein
MPAVSGVKLEIFLPDGRPVHIECRSDDNSCAVMKKFSRTINIDPRNVQYFGLFLTCDRNKQDSHASNDVLFDQMCVRWLKNFESPFASQQLINRSDNEDRVHYNLSVRKVVWDPSIEENLLDDQGSLKLLYLQVVHSLLNIPNFYFYSRL